MINTDSKINCFVCKKEIDNWEYESQDKTSKVEVHPMDGLHFRSYGNYGSTIFDPVVGGNFLDIAICDVCIMKNLDDVRGSGKADLEDNVDMIVDACNRHG